MNNQQKEQKEDDLLSSYQSSCESDALTNAYNDLRNAMEKRGGDMEVSNYKEGDEMVLETFMSMAGEPITKIESKELWKDMQKTNISSFRTLILIECLHSN